MREQSELSDFDTETDTETESEGDTSRTETTEEPPAWAASLMETVATNSEHISELLERSGQNQDQRDQDPQTETSRGYY